MKYFLLLFTLCISLQLSAASEIYSAADNSTLSKSISEDEKPVPIHYFAAASGVLGLALIIASLFSPLAILFGIAGLVLSIISISKQKGHKKHWTTWIGLVTSGLTVLVFLGVLILLYFFIL